MWSCCLPGTLLSQFLGGDTTDEFTDMGLFQYFNSVLSLIHTGSVILIYSHSETAMSTTMFHYISANGTKDNFFTDIVVKDLL